MRILRLDIVQFGKFSDFHLDLSEGLNIIEGKNESGKSTLGAFIKFAIYGFPRKNPNIAIGERERAIPWLGGVAKGSLTLEHEGKNYRIEREEKSAGKGSCKIIDLISGEPVFSGEVPGELFLGISEKAFDSMCNIRQLACASLNGEAVREAIENILTGGDEAQSADKALKAIEKERTVLLHKNGKGGRIFELENRCASLESDLIRANANEEKKLILGAEIKYQDENISKYKEAHERASRMCELYNDVLSLNDFRELAKHRNEKKTLEGKLDALDSTSLCGNILPSATDVIRSKSIADALKREREELRSAKEKYASVSSSFDAKSAKESKNEELSGVIEEFSTAENVISHIKLKSNKAKGAAVAFSILLVLSLSLFAAGVAIIILRQLLPGAITLFALGAVSLFVSMPFFFKKQRIGRELSALAQRIGNGCTAKDTEKIYAVLLGFESASNAARESAKELEDAKITLGVAEQKAESAEKDADEMLKKLGITQTNDKISALYGFADFAERYISERSAIEQEIAGRNTLIDSLERRLSGKSEAKLLSRITPEIEAELRDKDFAALTKEKNDAFSRLTAFSEGKAAKERALAELRGGSADPDKLERELVEARAKKASSEARLSAVHLALKTLEAASADIKGQLTPRISHATGELMDKMTNGKYSELYLGDEMKLSLFAEGETRPIEALSKGSCDLAYFAVRLSLISVMCAGKKVPIIMDETFSQLDRGREAEALTALLDMCRNGGQAILFTCRDNDRNIAEKVFGKNDINLVTLD